MKDVQNICLDWRF